MSYYKIIPPTSDMNLYSHHYLITYQQLNSDNPCSPHTCFKRANKPYFFDLGNYYIPNDTSKPGEINMNSGGTAKQESHVSEAVRSSMF